MKLKTFVIAGLMSISCTITSFAGWLNDQYGWYYEYAPNTRYTNCWQWIDGNNDGIAECYYFGPSGYTYMNTKTPDGYDVNNNGAWVVNGIVQTQKKYAVVGNNNSNSKTIVQKEIVVVYEDKPDSPPRMSHLDELHMREDIAAEVHRQLRRNGYHCCD